MPLIYWTPFLILLEFVLVCTRFFFALISLKPFLSLSTPSLLLSIFFSPPPIFDWGTKMENEGGGFASFLLWFVPFALLCKSKVAYKLATPALFCFAKKGQSKKEGEGSFPQSLIVEGGEKKMEDKASSFPYPFRGGEGGGARRAKQKRRRAAQKKKATLLLQSKGYKAKQKIKKEQKGINPFRFTKKKFVPPYKFSFCYAKTK